jgi:hypothetical protein
MKKKIVTISAEDVGKAMQTMMDFIKEGMMKSITVIRERRIERKPKRQASGNLTLYPAKIIEESLELRMKESKPPKLSKLERSFFPGVRTAPPRLRSKR